MKQRCRAFVFAALEDNGIAPVCAQAYGAPVIALSKGGTAETVRDLGQSSPTGSLFTEQTPEQLLRAVDRLEEGMAAFAPEAIRANAERFGATRFRRELMHYMAERLA